MRCDNGLDFGDDATGKAFPGDEQDDCHGAAIGEVLQHNEAVAVVTMGGCWCAGMILARRMGEANGADRATTAQDIGRVSVATG